MCECCLHGVCAYLHAWSLLRAEDSAKCLELEAQTAVIRQVGAGN